MQGESQGPMGGRLGTMWQPAFQRTDGLTGDLGWPLDQIQVHISRLVHPLLSFGTWSQTQLDQDCYSHWAASENPHSPAAFPTVSHPWELGDLRRVPKG